MAGPKSSEDRHSLNFGGIKLRMKRVPQPEVSRGLEAPPSSGPDGSTFAPRTFEPSQLSEDRSAFPREAPERIRLFRSRNLAHDLRNALSPIRGYARMLLNGQFGPVAPEHRELLSIIQANAEKALQITMRIEQAFGKDGPLQLEAVDFADVLSGVIRRVKYFCAGCSVRVANEDGELSIFTFADRRKLQRALARAIEISLRHTDRTVLVSLRRKGEYIELLISDRGSANGGVIPDRHLTCKRSEREYKAAQFVSEVVALHGGRAAIHLQAVQGVYSVLVFPIIQ